METITTKTDVYTIDELKADHPDAYQKALERYAGINVDFEWYDYDGLLDLTEAEMQSRKIKLSEKWYESDKPKDHNGNLLGEYPAYTGLIKYKIASFDLSREYYIQFSDIEVMCENTFRKFLRIPKRLWDNCYYTFNNSSNGFPMRSSNTIFEIEPDCWDGRDFTERQQQIIDRAIEIMTDKIAESLSNLSKSYDYLTSEPAILESLQINEYQFTLGGKIF